MARQEKREASIVDEIVEKAKGFHKLSELSVDDLVRSSDELGRELQSQITTSQLRKIFSEIKHIELETKSAGGKDAFNIDRVKMLKPKIAYLAGREKRLKPFKEVMDAYISKVKDVEDFGRLAEFMQAIMAYHKYHGGKD